MLRPWVATSTILLTLIICNTHTASAIEQENTATWDFDVYDGSTGQLSSNGSLVLVGDTIKVGFTISSADSMEDDRWELWMKVDDVWSLIVGGTSDDDGSISMSNVEILANNTGPHSLHLRLFPSSRTDVINFYVDPNPLDLVPAGQMSVAIQGEPLHEGDVVSISALVHNRGERVVDAYLLLSSGNDESRGSEVTIKSGSSKEIQNSLRLSSTGTQEVFWSIEGTDVGVSNLLSGSVDLTVLPRQIVQITSVEHLPGTDELSISILLSEGRNREVSISAGLTSPDGTQSMSPYLTLSIMPGLQKVSLPTSSEYSGQVEILVEPVNWQGNVATEQFSLIPIVFDVAISNQISTLSDGSLSIDVTLKNTGSGTLKPGVCDLIWSLDGKILASISTPNIPPGDETSVTITTSDLPSNTAGELTISYTSDINSYLSSAQYDPPTEDSSGFQLPFQLQAAVLGSLTGLVFILMAVLVMRTFENEVSDTRSKSSEPRPKSSLRVTCTTCNAKITHAEGVENVRCPACSTIMQTQMQMGRQIPNDLPKDVPLEVANDNDIINCPSCDQSLRVPLNRRPVMARCPACRSTFKALMG